MEMNSIISQHLKAKISQQWKTSFERTIKRDKYQSQPNIYTQNWHIKHLIDPSFQGVNRLFVLSFENDEHQRSSKQYFFSTIEIKGYNVMIDGKNFFDQPVKMI